MKIVEQPISRRRFLGGTVALTAGAPLLGALDSRSTFSVGAAGSNGTIRIGLVGSGAMGRGDLAAFLSNPDVECPVICDVDDSMLAAGVRLVEEQRGVKPAAVKDFRRVIDRRDVDAIVVATPDHWHAIPTIFACQAGKDVYVEKPLATSIDEGRAMLIAANRFKRVVQMGAQRRSSSSYAEAVDFVRSGQIGKVALARAWAYLDWIKPIGNPLDGPPPAGVDYDLWLGPAPRRSFNPNRFHFNFRWFWDYAGGLMTDWGVHLIQVLLWAMGNEPPRAVLSSGGKTVFYDNSETPDTQMTIYEFAGYTLVWEHRVGVGLGLYNRPWGMAFTGTEATLVINDAGWEILREPGKESPLAARFPGSPDPRPAHVRNFLDCVQSRQQPVGNTDEGHLVSTVAHLGNIAFRAGRKIRWDHENEKIPGDDEADKLVAVEYRRPWRLTYGRRS